MKINFEDELNAYVNKSDFIVLANSPEVNFKFMIKDKSEYIIEPEINDIAEKGNKLVVRILKKYYINISNSLLLSDDLSIYCIKLSQIHYFCK